MKIRKCPACSAKIKNLCSECPACGKKFVCKCGKELDDNKYSKCPICRADATEKRKKVAKGIGIGLAAVVTVLGTIAGVSSKNGGKHDV